MRISAGNSSLDVEGYGVAGGEPPSSKSGLCRGEGCASSSAPPLPPLSPETLSCLLGFAEPCPLRREYLWIRHLSKRDRYARVLSEQRQRLAIPSSFTEQAKKKALLGWGGGMCPGFLFSIRPGISPCLSQGAGA